MQTHVQIILHNSEAYREAVALRYRVLREPLGLTFTPEQLAEEAADTHLVAYIGERLAGSLMLHRQDADTVKMRQIAVAPEAQGQGLGRLLVVSAEDIAHRQGYKTIRLNARVTAVAFYARLGYLPVGEPFDEVSLPHLENAQNPLSKSDAFAALDALIPNRYCFGSFRRQASSGCVSVIEICSISKLCSS